MTRVSPASSRPAGRIILLAGLVALHAISTAHARPRDEPIPRDRMTQLDPPPLPEVIMLPIPPAHRIAGPDEFVPVSDGHRARAMASIASGLAALIAAQSEDGGWLTDVTAAPTDAPDRPAPVRIAGTALAAKAIAQAGMGSDDAEDRATALERALALIARAREEDGGYGGDSLANYVTAAVVSALASTRDPADRPRIDAAVRRLMHLQWDEGEGLGPRDDWYGGAGYGNQGRPDLSSTQMMLDALYDAGVSPDEPAFQRAVAFVSRAQNLRATNPAAWAGDDGGFVYTPANGGESMASEAAGEGRRGELRASGSPPSLRSYGSMSYAGFKSLLYAGLSPDDVRIRAVFDWVRRHWTTDENPGLGLQGYYYYLHAMARALRVAQQHRIVDHGGTAHNWREEIIDALVTRQAPDGGWTNDAGRWLEGRRDLATTYALLTLQECLKPVALPEEAKEMYR
ncbi:MAG: terpene cyclase/mutase family protein [Phycisphaeraceae bacterium]|nr:terpene cyclase/mutase family protein [Phycisphaeraceae bacterium]